MAGRKKTTQRRKAPAKPSAPETEPDETEEEESEEDSDEDEPSSDDLDQGFQNAVDNDDDEENESEEDGDDEDEELSPEDKVIIFTQYSEHVQAVQEATQALETAKEELADVVATIHSVCGKGPFEWKGQILHVATRKGKHYMRTERAEAEKIG